MGLSACATRPKQYQAPDAKRLTAAVEKATGTAKRAEEHIEKAQAAADKVAVTSVSVLSQVKELATLVPPELRARVLALEESANEVILAGGEVDTHLAGARDEHVTLGKDLAEAKAAKEEYQVNAQKLANEATAERNYRIAAEKQLTKEKIARWLWRIGGGVAVIGILVVIGLWFAGKISFAGIRAYLHI